MENKSMGMLLGAFVMLIIGVSLISVVATQSNLVSDKTIIRAETQSTPDGCFERATFTGGQFYAQVNDSGYVDVDCNLTVTNNPTGWKSNDCTLTGVSVTNATGADFTYTVSTDYDIDADDGVIVLKNTTATQSLMNTSNASLVSYTYCGDDYVNSSFGRTSLDITIGLFAIALLLGAVGMFYQVMKQEGLTNL